ncbi:CPBP family intramembrane metalloprotease [Candidatus Aerophobetes bacterium]|nr:CPBP family intramembrane metalloprotease [Candidatus Aerophobetes bacterium]
MNNYNNSLSEDTQSALPSRKTQRIEVAVFLFLVMPSLVLSHFVMKVHLINFKLVVASLILQNLSLLSLVLFFVWRNGESRIRIGWDFSQGCSEVALGALLFFPVFFGTSALGAALKNLGFSAPAESLPAFLMPNNLPEYLLAILLVTIIAVVEETIFRGYLILRFKTITKNLPALVALSTVIFALGHGYQGWTGLVMVMVMGIILALVYIWRKSLVAPMVIHFLQNFIAIVVVPIVQKG